MKPSETLTSIAEWFSEPGSWVNEASGAQGESPACLGMRVYTVCGGEGKDIKALHTNILEREILHYLCDAIIKRKPSWKRKPLWSGCAVHDCGCDLVYKWNDKYARDHRDVADLCHEAALLAKEHEAEFLDE